MHSFIQQILTEGRAIRKASCGTPGESVTVPKPGCRSCRTKTGSWWGQCKGHSRRQPLASGRHQAFVELTASREDTELISFIVCYINIAKGLNRSLINHVSLGELLTFPDPSGFIGEASGSYPVFSVRSHLALSEADGLCAWTRGMWPRCPHGPCR